MWERGPIPTSATDSVSRGECGRDVAANPANGLTGLTPVNYVCIVYGLSSEGAVSPRKGPSPPLCRTYIFQPSFCPTMRTTDGRLSRERVDPCLPPGNSRPSLEHLRNEATVLWKAFTAHDTDALERFTRHPRTRDSTKGEMKLADAQHVLALEYGFETWREMRDYVESDVVAVESLVRSGDAEGLDLLLREDPTWRSRRARWSGLGRETDLLTDVASEGLTALVEVLLARGVQSQVDITAVFYRCLSRRQLAVADLLLDQCAVEIHHLQEHLYQLTEDLNVEGVTWLLEHGANPDYRRAGTRWTPLHNALHTYPTLNRNRQQICHLLIGAGADHDDNALYDLLGQVDRLRARLDASPSLVHTHFDLRGRRDLEIERRGDYGGAPISNTTLLHHCAEYGWLEEARLLLERGADPNAPAESMEGDFDTRTPIYNTLTTNANVSWDVLNLLLASGADVNIRANVRVGEEALRDVTPHSRGAWG